MIKTTIKNCSVKKKNRKHLSVSLKNKTRLIDINNLISPQIFNLGPVSIETKNDYNKYIYSGGSGKLINNQLVFNKEDCVYQVNPVNYYCWIMEKGLHFYWDGIKIKLFKDLGFKLNFNRHINYLFKSYNYLEGILNISNYLQNQNTVDIIPNYIYIYDYFDYEYPDETIVNRKLKLESIIDNLSLKLKFLNIKNITTDLLELKINIVKPTLVSDMKQAYNLYQTCLNNQKEGLILKKDSNNLLNKNNNFYIWLSFDRNQI